MPSTLQPPTTSESAAQQEPATMVKPPVSSAAAAKFPALRSASQTTRQDLQFKDFGVLNTGGQSRASLFTSVTLNVVLLAIAVILGAAAKKEIERRRVEDLTFVAVAVKPPEPIRPKLIPPKPLPKPPVLDVKTIEPKILRPEVKIDPPKPLPVKPMETPKPAVVAAPPKLVVAAAAPRPVEVHLGQSASVVNHDAHPAPVALGQANNPIAPSNRPATASVNLGQRGLPGMSASNTGGGPASQTVNLGSGQPGGSLSGSRSTGVVGVKLGGVTNGTGTTPGNGTGNRPATVQLGQNLAPAPPSQMRAEHPPARSGPQVLYKPRPAYTAEATALHLEGVVSVRIKVSASGVVSVVGVTNGLGHGLDESAVKAVQLTRFKPAVDASGSPIDWEGVVNVSFQIAS